MSPKERYEAAIASLCEKLQKDRVVLAAVLYGSLAYDSVWDKSDIDLTIVVEESVKPDNFTLTEDGISIHASLMKRSAFKKVEGELQGGFGSSLLHRSKLLFTKDDSLALLWEDLGPMGARDRQAQLLKAATFVLPTLVKAEKWLRVKKDAHYAALYVLQTAIQLAKLEVYIAGESPGREAIHQALKLNPNFFKSIYTDVLDGPKTLEFVGGAWEAIDNYLTERIELCFSPLLGYLEGANGPIATRELNAYFKQHWSADALDLACDWLADKGIVERVGVPMRLAKDSRISVDEAGYYYGG